MALYEFYPLIPIRGNVIQMVDILFLGTGGGRINLLRQLRGTGGFLLIGKSLTIHVDPGPGALASLIKYGIDPLSTDALIVTHAHIDHVHDSPLIIEGMTGNMLEKKGALIASKSVLVGDSNGDKSITSYHQGMAASKIVFAPGMREKITLEKKMKGKTISAEFSITGTPVRHEDKDGFGFVIEMDGAAIGYTSDTEYFEGLPKHFQNCDVLIANNIKRAEDPYKGHLNSGTCARLFSECTPMFGIISHIGMGILSSKTCGPECEAQKIEKASGVKTFAARDGYYFCTGRCGWFKAEPTPKDRMQKSLFEINEGKKAGQ